MPGVAERIWQGTLGGFFGGLRKAHQMNEGGDYVGATIAGASVFYSYRLIWVARAAIEGLLLEEHRNRLGGRSLDDLSHGQCDIIGTILLRRFFWIRPNPIDAQRFLGLGLTKNPPPHSKTLLHIGLAEAAFLLGQRPGCIEEMRAALALRDAALSETNSVLAARQFTRVLRRAYVLCQYLHMRGLAYRCYRDALRFAKDQTVGSRSQYRKILRAGRRFSNPHFWHKWYD